MLEHLFGVVWLEGVVLCGNGERGSLLRKEESGNYRGITLLSVVSKVFRKILNNRLVECLERERVMHEGQAGFRKST